MTQSYVNDVLIKLFESAKLVDKDGNLILDKEGNPITLFTPDKNGKFTDINYEFEDFTKPENGVWYSIHFLPVMPSQVELGKDGMNEWTGIFQIDVNVTKSVRTLTPKMGVKDYFDNAYAAIAEVMKRGVIKDRVHITGIGRTPAYDAWDYYTMPISVSWYANLTN